MTRPLLLAAAMLMPVGSHAQSPSAGIARVAWLQGCWEAVTPARTIEEQWTSPRGSSMLGMGRTVRGDRLIDYELVVLREEGARLAYEAHPAGQPSAVFLSTSISAERVVFENRAHDFPQRVGYDRQGHDDLLAWIEGTEKGSPRRVEFAYHRARCAGDPQ